MEKFQGQIEKKNESKKKIGFKGKDILESLKFDRL